MEEIRGVVLLIVATVQTTEQVDKISLFGTRCDIGLSLCAVLWITHEPAQRVARKRKQLSARSLAGDPSARLATFATSRLLVSARK